jgi:outer membrane protein OmpA-like peptidoglycan-associated protein
MKKVLTIVLGAALAFPAPAAIAGDLSKDEIVCALDPQCANPPTRSLSRGISATGDVGVAGEASPAVDLYVNFAFDSAALGTDARITLDTLGRALRDKRLDGFMFLIAGHTDAKGSSAYNQSLSERRADAVRRYLIAQFDIEAQRLAATGYGKSRLLDPTHPEDGVNRRVQVVNVTASSAR